jgi:hypothetical protein
MQTVILQEVITFFFAVGVRLDLRAEVDYEVRVQTYCEITNMSAMMQKLMSGWSAEIAEV